MNSMTAEQVKSVVFVIVSCYRCVRKDYLVPNCIEFADNSLHIKE